MDLALCKRCGKVSICKEIYGFEHEINRLMLKKYKENFKLENYAKSNVTRDTSIYYICMQQWWLNRFFKNSYY